MCYIFLGKAINLTSATVYKLQKSPEEINKELEEFNYYNIDKVRERIFEADKKSKK